MERSGRVRDAVPDQSAQLEGLFGGSLSSVEPPSACHIPPSKFLWPDGYIWPTGQGVGWGEGRAEVTALFPPPALAVILSRPLLDEHLLVDIRPPDPVDDVVLPAGPPTPAPPLPRGTDSPVSQRWMRCQPLHTRPHLRLDEHFHPFPPGTRTRRAPTPFPEDYLLAPRSPVCPSPPPPAAHSVCGPPMHGARRDNNQTMDRDGPGFLIPH